MRAFGEAKPKSKTAQPFERLLPKRSAGQNQRRIAARRTGILHTQLGEANSAGSAGNPYVASHM
jgi:hypothetical protein